MPIKDDNPYLILKDSFGFELKKLVEQGCKRIDDIGIDKEDEWNFLRDSLLREGKKEGMRYLLILLNELAKK